MDDGDVHEKRFVVVGADSDTVTLVINSEIGPFIQARPKLLKCQVQIAAESHPFMDHDSHIDCSRLRTYTTTEVVRQLVAQPHWTLGSISDTVRNEIAAAMKASVVIEPAALSKWLPGLENPT
ncbi:hypothetical protein [Roseateles toxinivorans]|uniref:hypothetical protein n=1 Tax=Roseateles toxinivorans TaxID=270368 RepID=UPI00105D9321|nr:hypothetical protein [Roseateles toxinivorans]